MTSTARPSFARLAVALACAAALAASAASAAPADAASPTLRVTRVSMPPAVVAAGTRFRIVDVTANAGSAASRRTITAYLLSLDRRVTARDVAIAARRVRPLHRRATSRAQRWAVVPARTRPGRYWLIACAGARPRASRLPPSACRIARRRVRIVPASPTVASAPAIAGTAADGQVLTARTGSWRGVAPIAYTAQWRRCDAKGAACADVPGATAITYALTPADVGATMRVAVTARNARGGATAPSPPTRRVAPAPPAGTGPPGVAGTGVPGQTLSATSGAWAGTPPLTFTYRWQRCDATGGACADILSDAAGGPDYTLTAADAGPQLRVSVTARNAAGVRTAFSAPVPTGVFANPVFGPQPAPDPFVLDDGGRHTDYWEFHTGSRFPILHSTDLVHWTPAGTALRGRPAWVVQSGDSNPWAPSVARTDGPCPAPPPGTPAASGPCYVLFYVGLSAAYGVHCVGVATSPAPGGPYTDQGPLASPADTGMPIGCGDAAGTGNIDPSPFVDPHTGSAYLYVSTDTSTAGGNHLAPTISVIPLTPDMLSASGGRTPLFAGDAGTWEAAGVAAPTVEGPAALEHAGAYYLLYSGGSYVRSYAMGYATAPTPAGPFTKSSSNPILAATPDALTPGGGDLPVVGPNGGAWMAYHARAGSLSAERTLWIDRFSWRPIPGAPDAPVIAGPTSAPQPQMP